MTGGVPVRKWYPDAASAVAAVKSGDTVLVGGFGIAGVPYSLLAALSVTGVTGLTIVSNNAGTGDLGISALFARHCVRKIICSFPVSQESYEFRKEYRRGEVEVEVVPQGTLVERLRAAGSGLGGILTATGLDTELAAGKPEITVQGRRYLLETALRADVALIKANRVDKWGNATYRGTARNFNPVMATAADLVIAEANVLDSEPIDPDHVVTPGVYIDRVVQSESAAPLSVLAKGTVAVTAADSRTH